jgi:predicted house-cleaning NTP pyrophosphatase (Maf/HAM1 superfamily)
LSESDLNRLEYIKKYTEDIVLIISHIDEGAKRAAYIPQETINRLVQEARENVKDKLNLGEIDIFPIGSIQALQDNTYVNPIRECIHAYIEENTAALKPLILYIHQ